MTNLEKIIETWNIPFNRWRTIDGLSRSTGLSKTIISIEIMQNPRCFVVDYLKNKMVVISKQKYNELYH